MTKREFDDIYVEYAQFHEKLSDYKRQFRDMDEVAKAAPILFAVCYLAERISAENDRLIDALSTNK
jgi:hypothetical protein